MSEAEAKKAMETMRCPRCGAKLYYQDVFNDSGGISTDCAEVRDIYGHSFPILIKDFIAREGKRA